MSNTKGFNPYILVIAGKSGTGKSSSLENIKNPEKVLYLNCENGRVLPFRSEFTEITITHPEQVLDLITKANRSDKFDVIIIDSLTYLMDMFESVVINTSTDTRKAWGDYAQYFKKIMHLVAQSTKKFIFTAHTRDFYNESEMVNEVRIPIKGSLANNGIESYFSNVIHTKKVTLDKLEDYQNEMLNITEEEEILGIKHVLQTKLTKDTLHERIKSNKGLFSIPETFIDNNVQLIFDRLEQVYA